MFQFDFGIEEEDVEPSTQAAVALPEVIQLEPFAELSVARLLDALPPLISYSPLSIPLASDQKNVTLARRDLFDARFQLISDGRDDDPSSETTAPTSALEFLDAPSDLVPGVYEGGLKTWECSLDLVGYLDSFKDSTSLSLSNKRILEVGCGTAIPSIYLLYSLFCNETKANTNLHFQDYNVSVLELITLPNIILAWYMSPSSAEYRAAASDPAEYPPADPTIAGELPITPSLKSAFTASLAKLGISLIFSSGSWESLTTHLDVKYDIVLTSETIYRTEALPPLIQLLRRACADSNPLCLVAAKVLYFGVGGGVSEFIEALKSKAMVDKGCSGRVEPVWERKVGVGRKIMRIEWE
ncbi:hypothetical protein C8F04DRAFT_1148520 [Mycena alexandri]|uniref:protein-histidine N-methyltransferase n=1 Tax=Mycena alexandri TaxID=1745969 RepID=A0AAD6S2T5_9AGAR|nr:hypothetical protein C8F04DRAFT_1148520 [Mycena alexandri]